MTEQSSLLLPNITQTGAFIPLFWEKFKTSRVISSTAFRKHGIAAKDLAHAKSFAQHLPRILSLIHGNILVAHNASFDERVMNIELGLAGSTELRKHVSQVACSKNLAREVAPALKQDGGYSLDKLCDHFGIDRSSRIDPITRKPRHGALIDIELQSKVIRALEKRYKSVNNRSPGVSKNKRTCKLHTSLK